MNDRTIPFNMTFIKTDMHKKDQVLMDQGKLINDQAKINQMIFNQFKKDDDKIKKLDERNNQLHAMIAVLELRIESITYDSLWNKEDAEASNDII